MKNFSQPGNVLTVPAPTGGVVSGDPILIGALFGVAATTQAQGDDVEIAVTGVYRLPKAAVNVGQGAILYFDATAKKLTTDDDEGGNPRVGVAVAGAADAAADCLARLDGAAS